MTIKIGKQAIDTYVKTGKNTERRVLDYLPAGTLMGSKDNWGWYFNRPLNYATYVLDAPATYQRVRAAKYIQYAKATEAS